MSHEVRMSLAPLFARKSHGRHIFCKSDLLAPNRIINPVAETPNKSEQKYFGRICRKKFQLLEHRRQLVHPVNYSGFLRIKRMGHKPPHLEKHISSTVS